MKISNTPLPTREYQRATYRSKAKKATVNIKLPDGKFIQRVPKVTQIGNFVMMTIIFNNHEYIIGDGDEYLRGMPEYFELGRMVK